jgi:hypothetical protein
MYVDEIEQFLKVSNKIKNMPKINRNIYLDIDAEASRKC